MVIDLRSPNCTFGREDCLVKYKQNEDDSFDELEEDDDEEEEDDDDEDEDHYNSAEAN